MRLADEMIGCRVEGMVCPAVPEEPAGRPELRGVLLEGVGRDLLAVPPQLPRDHRQERPTPQTPQLRQ